MTVMQLRLRTLEQRDLSVVHSWENDMEAWKYSDNIAPVSERLIAEYIATYDADPFRVGQLRLLLTDAADAPLGLLDLYDISAIHAHAFVGIYIDSEHRNRGVGRQGLCMLCNYAAQHLGLQSLCAVILSGNQASEHLFRAAGFTLSGQLPRWRRSGFGFSDVLIYTRTFQNK